MPAPRHPLSELGARLALLAGGLIVALLLAEAGVRLLRPQPVWWHSPGLFVTGPEGGLELRPGFRGRAGNRTEFDTPVTVNSDGLRGPEIGPPVAGVPRVLVIGDSFVFGVGVEDGEAFPLVLAERLSAAGHPAQGLNGGLPAVGPVEEVDWLTRHVRRLRPDLVLVGLFGGNDLLDAATGLEGWEVVDGRLVAAGTTRGLRAWLFFNSHLFVLLKSSVPARIQRPLRAVLGLGEPPSLERARRSLELYARRPGELVRRGERRTAEALTRLSGVAGEEGFRTAAVVIPDLVTLVPALWEAGLRQLGADPELYDRSTPRRVLVRLLAAERIPVLDLYPAFERRLAAGEALYYSSDRHWTPAGHLLAAEETARFVLAAGLLGEAEDGLSPPAAPAP